LKLKREAQVDLQAPMVGQRNLQRAEKEVLFPPPPPHYVHLHVPIDQQHVAQRQATRVENLKQGGLVMLRLPMAQTTRVPLYQRISEYPPVVS